jgi:hypothetical protein
VSTVKACSVPNTYSGFGLRRGTLQSEHSTPNSMIPARHAHQIIPIRSAQPSYHGHKCETTELEVRSIRLIRIIIIVVAWPVVRPATTIPTSGRGERSPAP